MSLKRFTAFVAFAALPLTAIASPFPDVGSDYPYENAITNLSTLGVVQGNPDGTFAPERTINRAELLTLLYRAKGRVPRSVYRRCFQDIEAFAWYEDIVCDAEHEGYVQGYNDGLFRPEQVVNRVEAIKMILLILHFTIPTLTQEDRLSLDLIGVTHGSWYAPTLHRALELKLIPEEFIIDNVFIPDAPLSRGEVAEMIYRALTTRDTLPEEETEEAETMDEGENERIEERSANPVEETTPTGAIVTSFPIHEKGKTGARGILAYAFELTEPQTVLMKGVTAQKEQEDTVRCFLYLLGESGFSNEFFIGYQEEHSCFIRAALGQGHYQLEVRTEEEGEEVNIDAEKTSTTDGNDGFREAISLRFGSPRSGSLQANDYEDWYRFRIAETETRRVNLSLETPLLCSIYPSSDVDLFGFEAPRCDTTYSYPPGTYYISIQRVPPAAQAFTYTIEVR